VVGGGWAGFAAALALAKAGAEVTLLDASENPGGLSSAFTTPGGQMVEPGIKGFWYQVCCFCLYCLHPNLEPKSHARAGGRYYGLVSWGQGSQDGVGGRCVGAAGMHYCYGYC
jgi:phytoene dehydrogenase-like protein